jgi:hypothetical protein
LVGVGTHFGQNRGDVRKSFEFMRSAELNTYRDEIYWSDVEKQPRSLALGAETALAAAALDGAREHGLAPVLILCYGNRHYGGGGFPLTDDARAAFASYAGFLATRFRGKAGYYEVWNEWNAGMGHEGATEQMRSPETYLKLLQATYTAVKAADPSAIVLGGAVDGNERWTERLVALGGMRYMDFLTIHPYMFHAGKEGTPELLVSYLTRLGHRLAAANGGTAPPVFITETGWPTVDSRLGVSREQAADYVARTLLAVRAIPFVKGIWWYELQDGGTDPNDIQHKFGLIDAGLTPKPAYRALQAVAPLVAASIGAERVPTSGGEWVIRLRQPDDTTVVALWTPEATARRVELTVTVRTDTTAVVSRGAEGYRPGDPRALGTGLHRLDLEISASPVLVEFRKTAASVDGLRRK